MPVDTSIYQSPPNTLGNIMPSFLAGQQQRAQQQGQQQQDQLRQLQIDEHQQKQAAVKAEEIKAQRLSALFEKGTPTPEAIFSAVGYPDGLDIVKGLMALESVRQKSFTDTKTVIRDVLGGMDKTPEPLRAGVYEQIRSELIAGGVITEQDVPEAYDPGWFQQARQYGREPAKPAEPYTLSPGSQRFGADNQQVASVPPTPPAPPAPFTLPPGGTRFGADGQVIASLPPAAPSTAAAEPLVPVIGPDGQPVLVPRSQAAGKRPASTREQGRSVSSGDANKLAEFDTSLDDLEVLRQTLTETSDATGTKAAVGAALWNPITELTGWGTDAKKRQGVIDRVKQVIGKALEGGVLRKEDEYKYTKILPTIKDTPEVAASKLDGLESALIQRKQTLLDALSDAEYDTSRFAARPPRTPAVKAPSGPDAPLAKKNPFR